MLCFLLFLAPVSHIFAGTFDPLLAPDVVDTDVSLGGDQSPRIFGSFVA